MQGFIIRTIIVALGLALASAVVPGITIVGTPTLLAAAILLGVVNAVVRPIFVILTFPITVLSLGLFLWFINAAMLILVAWFLPAFSIAGFTSALFGSLLVSVTGWIASWNIGPRGQIEMLVIEKR